MKNEKSRIAELYAKLAYEVVLANQTTDNHYFLDYSGHCDVVNIRIYRNGWIKDRDPDVSKYFYLEDLACLSEIKRAISIVENFK